MLQGSCQNVETGAAACRKRLVSANQLESAALVLRFRRAPVAVNERKVAEQAGRTLQHMAQINAKNTAVYFPPPVSALSFKGPSLSSLYFLIFSLSHKQFSALMPPISFSSPRVQFYLQGHIQDCAK